MSNYSKLIGSLVGGALGFAVSRWGLPADFATPDIQGAVTILLGAAATFIFPANKPS
jgi:hypothetical protein